MPVLELLKSVSGNVRVMWEGDMERPSPPAWRELAAMAGLEESTIRQLATRRRFRRGEVVFHEGDPAGSLHLVDSGRLGVRLTTPLGDVATVEVLQRGDCFGEQALIDHAARRSATVAALEKTETLSLDVASCEKLRSGHPGFDRFLLMVLSARLRTTSHQLLEALYIPADIRVFRCVCRLCEMFSEDDQRCVPLTQTDIGAMTGVTRSTVSRVLQGAQRDGVIAVARGRIEVLDIAQLRRRARLGP
jgi:CRP/FNR family transcriptional regulator, cyclic AMP receptor protein